MATYVTRKGRVMAIVHIKPFPRKARTFATIEEARVWADALEGALRSEKGEAKLTGSVLGMRGLRAPVTEREILMLPRLDPAGSASGIYFLMNGDKCVYVGQSKNVHYRVRDHWRGRGRTKDFDSYSWVPCTDEAMNDLEKAYIEMLQPQYNHDYVSHEIRKERGVGQFGMKRPYAGDASRFKCTQE